MGGANEREATHALNQAHPEIGEGNGAESDFP